MKLTRIVAAHKKTIVAEWCKKEFMRYTDAFRRVRSGSRNKLDKCHWCKKHFEDQEMMALASFGGVGNKTLCQSCADELLKTKSDK